MSQVSLTAKYRPQTFAQVAGQDTVKAILSRASLEQRVAPAYLFSGTRGVGKTTLARIFAKALNCRNAPTAEPCNVCDQCRAVTAGSAVDVVEIDGASNRGIDDVRRLKEVVGYAAMEGGYKIFIIDEAHMLSREAFNALLKTLEEPPARVTFIMATTEPHKFPATIISRCQHYVFKPLSENGLSQHLSDVLEAEGIAYDKSAIRLIARRGAGSVRDSMSLLGQVLALGEGNLSEESARSVLGLAGQESFLSLLQAFQASDALAISRQLQQLLEQGLDLGFFLRELAGLWRNLFMLAQSGEAALPVVDLPENEARRYLEASHDFSLQQIHACWQMTLEGQRRVLTSLEPAQSLELLLLNLGMLPRLISLEKLSGVARNGPPPSSGGGNRGGQGMGSGNGNIVGSGQGPSLGAQHAATASAGSSAQVKAGDKADREIDANVADMPPARVEPVQVAVAEAIPEQPVTEKVAPAQAVVEQVVPVQAVAENTMPEQAGPEQGRDMAFAESPPFDPDGNEKDMAFAEPVSEPLPDFPPDLMEDSSHNGKQTVPTSQQVEKTLLPTSQDSSGDNNENQLAGPHADEPAPLPVETQISYPDWDDIITYCKLTESQPWLLSLLRRMEGKWVDGKLSIEALDKFAQERFDDPATREQVENIFKGWCGHIPEYTLTVRKSMRKSREELKAEVMDHPLVREIQEHFGGYVIDFGSVL